MDPKELRGLMEAYAEMYAPIDENRMASRMEKMPSAPAKVGKATHSTKDLVPSKEPTPEEKAKARKALGLGEAVKGESSERRRDLAAQRRAGDKPLSPAKGRDNANKMQRDIKYFDKLTKKNKNVVGLVSNEEVDLFDTVLEFLQVEGYAETLEEAEWLMANVIDREAIDNILEVLDTPEKANEYAKKNVKSMLGAFAKGVANKDISQLKTIQKRGEGAKMAKRKAERKVAALKNEEFEFWVGALVEEGYVDEGAAGDVAARAEKLAAQRKGQTPERKQMYASLSSKASERERGGPRIIDLGGRGGRKGLTQSDRDARREYDAEYSYETGDKNSTPGPGTITKNKRKLAAQKARGQHAESFDLYDIILSHLLDEGYADTEQAAEAIMVNMSEDWRESIVETRMDPRGRPASGPMNVYGKSKPNTDPAFQAALKSVREKEAKKTPEQRKAELDAYKERQMNR